MFLEAQDWWAPPGSTVETARHIHIGACFPLNQKVRGKVHIDVRVMLHNNPARLAAIKLHLGDGSAQVNNVVNINRLNVTCPTVDCTYWYGFDVDTTKYRFDGRTHWRFLAQTFDSAGLEGRASTLWQAEHANGLPRRDAARTADTIDAKGWYAGGSGYAVSRFRSTYPTAGVSGVWTFNVLTEDFGAGLPSKPVVHTLIMVDPAFHASPPSRGLVVAEKAGQIVGNVALDTRRLSNGPHKLVIRTIQAPTAAGQHGSVLVVSFVVRN